MNLSEPNLQGEAPSSITEQQEHINENTTDINTQEPLYLRVANMGAGKSFGELALMYNTPRAATIKADEDCVLLRLDRVSYQKIVAFFKVRVGIRAEGQVRGKRVVKIGVRLTILEGRCLFQFVTRS